MQEEVEEYKDPKLKDITYNWVNSSVFLFYLEVFCIIALLLGGCYGFFLFYLEVFCIIALLLGGCYGLYTHRYKGKPDVVVPANTQYTPEYK